MRRKGLKSCSLLEIGIENVHELTYPILVVKTFAIQAGSPILTCYWSYQVNKHVATTGHLKQLLREVCLSSQQFPVTCICRWMALGLDQLGNAEQSGMIYA